MVANHHNVGTTEHHCFDFWFPPSYCPLLVWTVNYSFRYRVWEATWLVVFSLDYVTPGTAGSVWKCVSLDLSSFGGNSWVIGQPVCPEPRLSSLQKKTWISLIKCSFSSLSDCPAACCFIFITCVLTQTHSCREYTVLKSCVVLCWGL